MQQTDYQFHGYTPRMQESVSMHKSPTPVRNSRMNQARSEEEELERGAYHYKDLPSSHAQIPYQAINLFFLFSANNLKTILNFEKKSTSL